MQSEKCKSCYECSETVIVKVRDERGGDWRDSSVRRCANNQCWHVVDGTREDRLAWINNVYDYKYFGDYELSPEQLSAVYEAKSLAALSAEQTQPVAKEWCAYEDGHQHTSWNPDGYGNRAGWEALAKRNPSKYQVHTRDLFTSPPLSREGEDTAEVIPHDPTDTMIDAALAVNWECDGDERATAINVWHAMYSASLAATRSGSASTASGGQS